MENSTGTHVGFLMSFRISEEDCRRKTVLQISQHSLTLFPLVTHLNYLPTLSSMMTLTWSSLCRLLLISCSSGKDGPWHNNKSGIRPSLPIGLCGHCKTSENLRFTWISQMRTSVEQDVSMPNDIKATNCLFVWLEPGLGLSWQITICFSLGKGTDKRTMQNQ